VETVYLANPSVSPEEILHAIAFELQLPLARDAGRLEVMHCLNEFLLARHAEGRQVVVFVEESQSMPIATLEEIRLLSNLETRQHKLLQIVLFGQPELDVNLRKREIRQLRERITHSFSLAPLDSEEVSDYLGFRLRAAGYHGPDLFSPRVIAYMARATGGLTRRLNIVADKALLAAFAEGTHNVSYKHVRAAIADSEFSADGGGGGWLRWPAWVGAAALLALVAVGAGWLQRGMQPELRAMPSAAAPTTAAPAPPPGATQAAVSQPDAPSAPLDTALAAQAIAPAAVAPPATVAATAPGTADATIAQPATGETTAFATARALPAAPSSADAAGPDLLEQRLLATERWLAEADAGVFSIQLLGSTDQQMLKRYLNNLTNYIERDRIFVYRTVANQAPSMTVLYGEFAARADAVRSLDGLPPELRANRPYIRTVQGIRSELGLDKPS
jgi:type II secretory pathway predicted ATPase ExeA/septal ring-binding cell division protein DamX